MCAQPLTLPDRPGPVPLPAAWPWRRAAPLLALAGAVLLAHLGLLGGLGPGPDRRPGLAPAAMAPPAAMQLLPPPPARPLPVSPPLAQLPLPPLLLPPLPLPPLPLPTADAPLPPPATQAVAAAAAAGPTPGRAPAHLAEPGRATIALDSTIAETTLVDSAPPVAEQVPTQVWWPAQPDPAGGAQQASPEPAPPGQPPPVYPTRVPAPVLLHYSVRAGDQVGQARLTWRHGDGRYRLELNAWGPAGPLLEQTSEGGFDHAGLAPDRFIDRRRGRGWRAANFQRDIGRISFSGPRSSYPAWPGAQDRLSWIAQLAAISAASSAASSAAVPVPAVGQSPGALGMFVVDARGLGDVWQLQPQAAQELATALGPVQARPWQRDPPRPEGLRVQAWLDPSRGHWPVRLRLTALRSGALFELELAAEPGLPP